MHLIVGSDRAGFPLKERLKQYLDEAKISYKEIGVRDPDEVIPYYDVAAEAAVMLQKGKADKAVLICGTGMGMAQIANCYKGIRGACVESVYAAKMSRRINDSNALCMGAWIVAPEMGISMLVEFLSASFTEGLEDWRQEFLRKAKISISALEDEIYSR